jgi:hypothetical protein
VTKVIGVDGDSTAAVNKVLIQAKSKRYKRKM